MNERARLRWTLLALRSGQIAAVALLAVALALEIAGSTERAVFAATVGVLLVVATPALALAATAAETWRVQRTTAALAGVVLAVLALAVALAAVAPR